MPREYNTNLTKYGISKNRFKELQAFCWQYNEKLEDLKNLYSASFVAPEVSVMGGVPGNPTQAKAILTQPLNRDIKLIDECVASACSEDIGVVECLKKSVTEKKSYYNLANVPCGKNQFYNYRRKFFLLLNEKKKW